jgi:hypothetical protein
MVNYIEAIGEYYPNLSVSSTGDGSDYASLFEINGKLLPSPAELQPKRLLLGQDRMWKKIQVERDRRKYNGVKVGANWYHSDDPSRIQQIGLVLMGAGMPAGIMWKTLSGGFVQMTPTLALQIFSATGAQDMAIFAKAEYHKAYMVMSPSPSTYDFSTGWPVTFGE